tara:strand:+ start:82 stop:654 length:573 start_codon:yes stop_codon:yes gene_type:complete
MAGGWSLRLDEVSEYAWQLDVFSKEECSKIIKYGKKQKSEKATTFSKVLDMRKNTNICWLSPDQEIDWVFQRLTSVILNLNEKYFKFNLFALNEPLQFTHYHRKGACYKKHVDKAYNQSVRKLSISVQLSDESSYDGCELHLHNDEHPHVAKKDLGSLTAFPSYTLHEVTSLKKGERFALVTWVTGEGFK